MTTTAASAVALRSDDFATAECAALEARLAAHAHVAHACVLPARRAGAWPVAFVVPTVPGLAYLRSRGWLGYVESLEAELDVPSALEWRFVEAIPAERDRAELLVATPMPVAPEVLAVRATSARVVELRARVPIDVAVCREHFPRAPIVPGVVQLSWADAWAREHAGLRGRFVALESVKFRHIVQPGDVLDARLEWDARDGRLHVRTWSSAGRHLGGRIVYE